MVRLRRVLDPDEKGVRRVLLEVAALIALPLLIALLYNAGSPRGIKIIVGQGVQDVAAKAAPAPAAEGEDAAR